MGMIKPIDITRTVQSIVENPNATKAVKETALEIASEGSAEAKKVAADLLQAYKGVTVKRLFSSLPEFIENYKAKLGEYKESIPESLYEKLVAKADAKDFSLTKTVSEYYAGLEKCKSLEEVKKAYPEIEVPKLDFISELGSAIRGVIPKSLCDEIASLTTLEEKQQRINRYLDSVISKQVESWEIYPNIQQIKSSVAKEVIDGTFKGRNISSVDYKLFNQKMPLRYRLLRTENPEQTVLQMIKENYLAGKPLSDISATSIDGKIIPASNLRRGLDFSYFNPNLRTILVNTEKTAMQFKELAHLDASDISSAVMSQTWRTSRLRTDLGNSTAYGKDWSLVKSVWHKSIFPDQTNYPTDKLVETYLLGLFKAGKRQADTTNPFAKLLEDSTLGKNKIMLLKRLYKESRTIDYDRQVLKSPMFQEFKSQFDVEGMSKSLESIEEHYKNVFFKMFWTDERKLRFTEALNMNKEIARQNIEITDEILVDAMKSGFDF